MRVELGSGDRPTPGWLHNDARPLPHVAPHMVFDAAEASKHVGVGTCEMLRATHLLEHFGHRRTHEVLCDWHACLAPGGQLYLEVPNLESQARLVLTGGHEEAVRLIFGDQDHPGNHHHTAFTARTLGAALVKARFLDVQVQDIGQVLCARARKSRGGECGTVKNAEGDADD